MLTITDYKNWAVQNQTSAIALNGDSTAIVKESSRAGRLARAFSSGSVKELRGAVVADFTRALSARYGESIARQALAAAGVGQTSRLHGARIMQAVQAAKSLRARMLRPAGAAQDIRLGGTDVSGAAVAACLADKKNPVAKFMKQRAVAVQLLGEMPLTRPDFEDFHARLSALVSRLVRLKSAAAADPASVPEGVPAGDFADAVDALLGALYDKDAQTGELVSGRPLGEANLQEYKDDWRAAAVNAMRALARGAADAGKAGAAGAIESALAQFKDDANTRGEFDARVQPAHGVSKKVVAPFVAGLVKRALREAGVRGFKVDAADIARRVDEGFQKHLNERAWKPVEKNISTKLSGRPLSLKSTIAPAENLGRTRNAPRGPIASRYPDGVHGYMCGSSKTDHAVNLSVSSIAVGEPGGAQTVAFKGVRHGVHSAWGIRSADERAAANARRAEEAVIAAFLAKFDAEDGPALPEPGEDGAVEVDLRMTSVALLTPDATRHALMKGSGSDERRMLAEQSAAWDAVSLGGVSFGYKGRQIRVRPQILKFNFGVNEGAVNKLFRLTPDMTGGWKVSGRMNRMAFQTFQEEVEAFLRRETDERTKTVARTLLDQCRRALRSGAERRDAHDAYKVAARIAVLSHLIGNVPCWNCKSGKDRTGQMDVECKFLSTLIARGEPLPEPGAGLDDDQKTLFRSIALEGGNFEIQKMNTALAGFKTGKVGSIAERLGGATYREFHKGGSDHVNV